MIFATQFLNLDAEVKGVEVETHVVADRCREAVRERLVRRLRDHARLLLPGHDGPDGAVAPGAQPVGPGGAQTLVGNSLPNSPEVKYTIGANYTWNWTPGALTFGGTYSYTDDLQSNVFSNPICPRRRTRSRISACCGTMRENRYTIIGFVKNAFDEEGYHPLDRLVADRGRLAPDRRV